MTVTDVKAEIFNFVEKADPNFLNIVHSMFKMHFREQRTQQLERETELLNKIIKGGLTSSQETRLDELRPKIKTEDLNEDELKELEQLVEKVEDFTAKRVGYLVELAQIRGVKIDDLMRELNIKPRRPYYA